ncbi:hypothetical protein P343_06100 [Sporolactobacillus laevolacticus DSM 442]|uniref:Uncharacterized protein n=1 Tax=Sporolactobacillus laevolacticus DSM 442 TaxID=1395513 RepID=V6J7L5_9BACL|nr:hypothetical protein P343_06100 [Sporolactobacillus laevolacticus DSM 442]
MDYLTNKFMIIGNFGGCQKIDKIREKYRIKKGKKSIIE